MILVRRHARTALRRATSGVHVSVRAFDPLRVPDDFWSRGTVHAALRARDVGLIFRLLRKYAGASQTRIGAAVGLEQGYISRVMNGRRTVTAIDLLDRIAAGCRMPDECRMLFGLAPLRHPWHETTAGRRPPNVSTATQALSRWKEAGPADVTSSLPEWDQFPPDLEWPVAAGVRLAHMVGMVDGWRAQDAYPDILQTLLDQEILLFDAFSRDSQHPAHVLSRRQALATIAALPVASSIGAEGGIPATTSTVESFLSRCAASLTACWHLLRGSDLDTVHQVISAYILKLESIARPSSSHQATAARLASQAHRIFGIVALHRSQLGVREHHCRQALTHAAVASDAGSRASALMSLAITYYYGAEPLRAARLSDQCLPLASSLSPLHQSKMWAELSAVYGQLGRESECLRSADLAEQLFPRCPEEDPAFLYGEFSRAKLTLERGLAHVALAERLPDRKYQEVATDIFARVETEASAAAPDRIRYEIISHQALAAVRMDDLDAFEVHLGRAVDGVVLLKSRQRHREVRTAWRAATERWPHERRLAAVDEHVRAITGRVRLSK